MTISCVPNTQQQPLHLAAKALTDLLLNPSKVGSALNAGLEEGLWNALQGQHGLFLVYIFFHTAD